MKYIVIAIIGAVVIVIARWLGKRRYRSTQLAERAEERGGGGSREKSKLLTKGRVGVVLVSVILTVVFWLSGGAMGGMGFGMIVFFGAPYWIPVFVLFLFVLIGWAANAKTADSKAASRGMLLAVFTFILTSGAMLAIATSPYWIDKNFAWEYSYHYRFTIELEMPSGPEQLNQTIVMQRKTFSLHGNPVGTIMMRDRFRTKSSYSIGDGIYVGYPGHMTGKLATLFPDTLRQQGLPLHGRDYKGIKIEVDKELFPRLRAYGLKHHDAEKLALYQSAIANGKYKIYIELLDGKVQVSQDPGLICKYLLKLEVKTPDGLRRAEQVIKILREEYQTGDGKKHIRLRRRGGTLLIQVADGVNIVLNILPHEWVTLPGRLVKATGRAQLGIGESVEVPHALIEEHHYKGLYLGGKNEKNPPNNYQYISEGKGEFTLWFEMLEGIADYEIP